MYEDILGKKVNYTLIDCQNAGQIPTVDELFNKFDGVSITSPYKKHFLKQVHVADEFKALNAINCLKYHDGRYEGINTDFLAIDEIIQNFLKKYKSLSVAVLGDGVMSTITTVILQKYQIPYQVFSRKINTDFYNLNLNQYFENIDSTALVINCCSRDYVFKGHLNKKMIFWDYNYNFSAHALQIPEHVRSYIDGLEMLNLQARYALRFWSFL
ncbi:MAG: hypothetical protein ISR65_10200 [Bacteriovoracaceae bacterium]|nr:hypothetical protein [Bacteriovoracaceae bacterium]